MNKTRLELEAEEFLRTRQKKTSSEEPLDRQAFRFYTGAIVAGILARGKVSEEEWELLPTVAKLLVLAENKYCGDP